jgi:hypothetical protein
MIDDGDHALFERSKLAALIVSTAAAISYRKRASKQRQRGGRIWSLGCPLSRASPQWVGFRFPAVDKAAAKGRNAPKADRRWPRAAKRCMLTPLQTEETSMHNEPSQKPGDPRQTPSLVRRVPCSARPWPLWPMAFAGSCWRAQPRRPSLLAAPTRSRPQHQERTFGQSSS